MIQTANFVPRALSYSSLWSERGRETGRRENLGTRLPNSRLERRKVFASHSFLFKHITNMTGRFPKTLQMRITKKRRLKLKKGELYKLYSLTEFSLAYRQV